jgi:hypothetical protein
MNNISETQITHALEALDHFSRNMQGGELLLRHVETLKNAIKGFEAEKRAAAFEAAGLAECVRYHPELFRDWADQLFKLAKRLGFEKHRADEGAHDEAIDF